MATTEHYDFWYLDPDEEISDFPNTWDFNIDKLDAAIHEAATDNVTLARIPNLPASKTTSGTFADARIPDSIARTSDVNTGNAALNNLITGNTDQIDILESDVSGNADRLDGHSDRIDTNKTDLESLGKRVDTTETDIEDHDKRLDDLEDNQGDGDGGGDSKYRQEEIEPEAGTGIVSIERKGPLVFIWGSLSIDEDISANTKIFTIPEWAQTGGICLMPCMADDSTANLQVSGSNAIATTSLSEGVRLYGSITYLTTEDMGDEDE